MKSYREMAENVLNRRNIYLAERKKRMKTLGAALSCVCLCLLLGAGIWSSGISTDKTPVISGQNDLLEEPVQSTESASTASPAESSGTESSGKDADTWPKGENTDGDKLFSVDGSPLAPQVTHLTQEALYGAVGGLLPHEAPAGFAFESAFLAEYGYSALWSRGLEELSWRIRDYTEADARRITSVADTENYDLALYPIPRAETVPEALMEIVNAPIFRAEELTREAVYARAYKVEESGDSGGYRMHFSVLYGDKLITVISKGVSPDWLYEQLCGLAA